MNKRGKLIGKVRTKTNQAAEARGKQQANLLARVKMSMAAAGQHTEGPGLGVCPAD